MVWASIAATGKIPLNVLESCTSPHPKNEPLKTFLEREWIKIVDDYLSATVNAFPKRFRVCNNEYVQTTLRKVMQHSWI
ncbi:unnamed protein product [Caenorhabditis auriculariae]|uniref:Uncharacterized protein n=1 Tax=Caenorhabditis auriculariae TaxID=2777116 RepID=A0A8S1GQN2_9PELO|nr:unnamed protein product [Caenorhabditis auriculariae]